MFLRADARVAVHGPEPHAYLPAGFRVVAVERRPADRAEALREAAVAGVPALDELLALRDPERAVGRAGVRRRPGAGAPLAARAVTVVGGHERLADLVAHASAQATPGDDRHGLQVNIAALGPGGADPAAALVPHDRPGQRAGHTGLVRHAPVRQALRPARAHGRHARARLRHLGRLLGV